MKKISKKQRSIDVKIGIINRHRSKIRTHKRGGDSPEQVWEKEYKWIDDLIDKGLDITVIKPSRKLVIQLPEEMNFYQNYDNTILYITAIRGLAQTTVLPYKAFRLSTVNFDRLKHISTSAALVLTAELSKWDDAIRQKLRPMTDNWDTVILKQFTDLGFFDLFKHKPVDPSNRLPPESKRADLVRYIKGRCGDSRKARVLNKEITAIVGDKIEKWTFLRCGLDEAVTNVSHHAYPDNWNIPGGNKNWYLTGSYNDNTKELKIVFYDQGIGIPKSLPASSIWERTLVNLSKLPIAERKRDEVLLKAAVELDRTSTQKSDRGKGLQDMLVFIRKRGDGYLSILSLKGLYKLTVKNGIESVKSEHFELPICGTLIIWSVNL